MRIILLAAAMLAGPALARPATPAQLETEMWRAFKAKDVKQIRPLFAPDFVGLYADGTHDLARELQSLQHVTIEDYKLSDWSSKEIGPHDVLLTYAADLTALVDAKPVSERLWMASLWHRRASRWVCIYHTEIRAK